MTTSTAVAAPRILYDACPLCASKNFDTLRTEDCTQHPLHHPVIGSVINWMECAECEHIFTDGYFTDESSRIVFSKTHNNQQLGYAMESQRPISARMIEKVLPYVQSGHWLDIGFGDGSLLFTAHEYGFTPVGIDLRQENVAQLKQLGIEAHAINITQLEHKERYSVVSMADVLEHMPYPKLGLASAHKLMMKGGIALISMPNAESMLWQAMDMSNANPYWREIEHFHNFGKSTLYKLLKECGFEPLRYGVSERYRVCMEIVARKVN